MIAEELRASQGGQGRGNNLAEGLSGVVSLAFQQSGRPKDSLALHRDTRVQITSDSRGTFKVETLEPVKSKALSINQRLNVSVWMTATASESEERPECVLHRSP
jgi:hypothetical protein